VQQNDGSFAGICVGDVVFFELRSFQIEVLKYKSRIIYFFKAQHLGIHDSPAFPLSMF
jgi:hypothetical protein